MVKNGLITCLLYLGCCAIATAHIVASIRPLGLLIAELAHQVTEVRVLVPDYQSPHRYQLKPSDQKSLAAAKLIFWISPSMETFLSGGAQHMAPKATWLMCAELTSIQPLIWKGDFSNDKLKPHQQDFHIWLSPIITKVLASEIAAVLRQHYPEKEQQIAANLERFTQSFETTLKDSEAALKPVKAIPYLVLHDAYGYFERYFKLNHAGHFLLNPALSPSSKNTRKLVLAIRNKGVKVCFGEPQFTQPWLKQLSNSAQVRYAVLDPIGTGIALDLGGYIRFFRTLTAQFVSGLSEEPMRNHERL